MKLKLFLLLNLIGLNLLAQWTTYKISRPNQDICESTVNVTDERPEHNCDFSGNNTFVEVFKEEFDFKNDLPNNWTFGLINVEDDDAGSHGYGNTWIGNNDPAQQDNGFYNNLVCTNGNAELIWKKEQRWNKVPCSGCPSQNYEFTGVELQSLVKSKAGVFEARIKFPENNQFWPGFWLMGAREIDIVEFMDGDIEQNVCDTYHQMAMTIHGHGEEKCNRSRKFPVPENPEFFDDYHLYKCVWTDYRIEIYLDNFLVGYATKYYDGPWVPHDGCQHWGAAALPGYTRDCEYMRDHQACNRWFFGNCLDWVQVRKDEAFPETFNPMQLLITNSVFMDNGNGVRRDALMNDWGNISADNKKIKIDYVKIYQQRNNTSSKLYTLNDFFASSGNTSFLTGTSLTIGDNFGTNTFNLPNAQYTGNHKPLHLLATEEIALLNDISIEENTFLRAEIIGGGFSMSERTTDQLNLVTNEEIRDLEKREIDSLLINNHGNILANVEIQAMPSRYSNDNGAITIYPNPSENRFSILISEQDYFDLIKIELIDQLGRKVELKKTKEITLESFPAGIYDVKFIFSSGFVVDKLLVKK